MQSYDKQIRSLATALPRDAEDERRIEDEIQFFVRQKMDLMKDPAKLMWKRQKRGSSPPPLLSLSNQSASDESPSPSVELNPVQPLLPLEQVELVPRAQSLSRRTSVTAVAELDFVPILGEQSGDLVMQPNYLGSVSVPLVTTTRRLSASAPTSVEVSEQLVIGSVRQTTRQLPAPSLLLLLPKMPLQPDGPIPIRRRSTSYYTVPGNCLPSPAPLIPFPTEAFTPIAVQQPFSAPQYQILQQVYSAGFPLWLPPGQPVPLLAPSPVPPTPSNNSKGKL